MKNYTSLISRQPDVWLRVVSHNVFWFQGQPFKTDQPQGPDAAVLGALAQMYHKLDIDLLCMQEVQSRQAFEQVGAVLDHAGGYTPGAHFSQYGAASFGPTIRVLADSQSADNKPQRVWQLLQITKDDRSLIVGNLHLPSARHVTGEQAQAHRVAELQMVINQPQMPDVILGDFNEALGGCVDAFLTSQGYLDAATLAGKRDLPTTPRGRRGDQIWVHQTIAGQIVDFGAVNSDDMQAGCLGKEFLSDHFPIWIDLKAKSER